MHPQVRFDALDRCMPGGTSMIRRIVDRLRALEGVCWRTRSSEDISSYLRLGYRHDLRNELPIQILRGRRKRFRGGNTQRFRQPRADEARVYWTMNGDTSTSLYFQDVAP